MDAEWICKALLLIVLSVWVTKVVDSKPCAFEVNGSSGIISSDSIGNYKQGCSWIITSPSDHNIRLNFTIFQLFSLWGIHNWIHVYDGRSTNDALLGMFSGTRRPFIVQSSGSSLLVKLTIAWGDSLCIFKGYYTSSSAIDKPRVKIPVSVVRAIRGHYLWCLAEGTPPLNLTLLKNSTPIANGAGIVAAKMYEEGKYTCLASNEAGSESKDFQVAFTDCQNLCRIHGRIENRQVENGYGCTDTHLPADFLLQCVPTTTTKLILNEARIRNIPTGAFRHMAALKLLALARNDLQNLKADTFSTLVTLHYLHLASNELENLTEDIFSSLETLQLLYLDNNRIVTLPEQVFSRLTSLMILWLSGNKIVTLPEQVFSRLPSLTILWLSDNKIVTLPEQVFCRQTRLIELYLYDNKIVTLPEQVFSRLTSLTYLLLHKNNISIIFNESFANLTSLEYLFLGDNRLQEIPQHAFKNLKRIIMILLQKNRLQKIPYQAFKNLKSLQIIMLSDNPIKIIGWQAFTVPNGNLLIYMIRTQLKTISSRSFDDIHNFKNVISLEEGQIGTMKFMDAKRFKCTVHLGSGQDGSEHIDISTHGWPINNYLNIFFGQAGFANKILGAYKLLPCPLGTFVNSSVSDDYKCQECPAGGFYSDTEAYVNDSCRHCTKGTFVHYNKAPGKSRFDCKACPQGTDTDAFAGFRACKCLTGFYRTHLFQGCKRCNQIGLECLDDYVTLKKGYWWWWKNDTHRELYKNFTIILKNDSYSPTLHSNPSVAYNSLIEYAYTIPPSYKCPTQEACTGGTDSQLCVPGYRGPLCGVCDDGYYRQLNLCRECPTKKWMAGQFSILAAFIAIITFVIVWRSKKESNENAERSLVDILLGRIKIVIGFYQVTFGVLAAFSYIEWPDSISFIGKYSEIIQLNLLQIAPVQCVIPYMKVDAFGSLFVILGLNGAAIIVGFVSFGITKLVYRRKNINKDEKSKKTSAAKQLIYRNVFFFLYVTYLSTCSKIASVLPLACHKLCADENEESCKKFLKADYNVECAGTKYDRLVIVAYVAVGYVILLPTASLITIWQQRKAIRKVENETENGTLDVEDQGTEVLIGLRFLFENYTSDSWYWELVETVRKVILTSGMILVGGEGRAYIGLACTISGLYGIIFALQRPICDTFENKLMLTSLAVTFVNLEIGAVSRIPEEGIPSSIDPYVDSVMFNGLVIFINSLVIGLLVVQYIAYIYHYVQEWRKNPQWSFSCCLALLLPLNDLQGEIRGLTGKNMLREQLQTGTIDMPSMSAALQDSGAVAFAIDNQSADESSPGEINESRSIEQADQTIATVTIHEIPKETCDTKL